MCVSLSLEAFVCLCRCLCVCALEPMCLHVHLLVSVCVCLCESRQYLWEYESSPFVRGTLDWPLLVTFPPGLPASQGTPAKAAHSLSFHSRWRRSFTPDCWRSCFPQNQSWISRAWLRSWSRRKDSPLKRWPGEGLTLGRLGAGGGSQVTLEIQE